MSRIDVLPEEAFTYRARFSEKTEDGFVSKEQHQHILPSQGAVLICDMWNKHWCVGASQRVDELAPVIDRFVRFMRNRGFLIIHCPSNTMDHYAEHPARKRILEAPQAPADPPLLDWCPLDETRESKLPFDDSDGGCFCGNNCTYSRPYDRGNDAIFIDPERDVIGDKREVYDYLRYRGIKRVFYCGVHANMCVPGRAFGIRQMTYQGIECVLVRDLIDVMYNPAMPPYIDHFDAVDKMAEHIERYWCPTALSGELMHDYERPMFRFVEDYRLF